MILILLILGFIMLVNAVSICVTELKKIKHKGKAINQTFKTKILSRIFNRHKIIFFCYIAIICGSVCCLIGDKIFTHETKTEKLFIVKNPNVYSPDENVYLKSNRLGDRYNYWTIPYNTPDNKEISPPITNRNANVDGCDFRVADERPYVEITKEVISDKTIRFFFAPFSGNKAVHWTFYLPEDKETETNNSSIWTLKKK